MVGYVFIRLCTLGACTGACSGTVLTLSSVFGCRMSCSCGSLSMVLSQSCGGIFVVSIFASPTMAATIRSSGLTAGLVRYLCLNQTAPNTRVLCVPFIQIVWHR